jgi:hypothetical protein
MVLSAFPRASVRSFDLCSHAYAVPNFELLKEWFQLPHTHGGRLELTCGDSRQTLKAHLQRQSLTDSQKGLLSTPPFFADVVRVDGGHSFDAAFADIVNAQRFAWRSSAPLAKANPTESEAPVKTSAYVAARRNTLLLVDDCESAEVAAAWRFAVDLGAVQPLRAGLGWKGSCVGHFI